MVDYSTLVHMVKRILMDIVDNLYTCILNYLKVIFFFIRNGYKPLKIQHAFFIYLNGNRFYKVFGKKTLHINRRKKGKIL